MKQSILVIIGQIGSGKTTLGRRLASTMDADVIQIEKLPPRVRASGPATIVSFVIRTTSRRLLVFECSGASETFEDLLSKFELHAHQVLVVKLLCESTVALQRLRQRGPWQVPVSGVSWASEIVRTDTRLRRVPADLTLDTTRLDTSQVVDMVKTLVGTTLPEIKSRALRPTATWTFSELAVHERCPLAHHFKYVEGIPEIFLSEKTLLGELVHSALSRLYGPTSVSKKVVLDELLEGYLDSVERIPIGTASPNLKARLREEGSKLLTFHYQRIYEYDQLRTLQIEHNFSVDLGAGRRISGQIDRIAQSRATIPVVIDYKTGSDRASYLSDVPDLLQLEVYGCGVLLELRVDAVDFENGTKPRNGRFLG